MAPGTFCTVFDCMDGRCQEPTNMWVRDNLKVRFPDTITDAGMDRVLAFGNPIEVAQARARAELSTSKHGSHTAVIVGHAECAGNPVDDDQHHIDIEKACENVLSWGIFDEVVGLFEGSEDGCSHEWHAREVCRFSAKAA